MTSTIPTGYGFLLRLKIWVAPPPGSSFGFALFQNLHPAIGEPTTEAAGQNALSNVNTTLLMPTPATAGSCSCHLRSVSFKDTVVCSQWISCP